MKCLFIYNPNSGKGKINKKKDYIYKKLCEKFESVDMIPTQRQKHALELASGACGKYDYLIFSGGDGTFNEVIQGVSSNENRPILGYIPTGTVNDNARNLGVPKSIKKIMKIILRDNQINMDICKIGEQYFSYVAAIGSFTSMSYATSQIKKKYLGTIAYAIDGIKDFFHTNNFDVKLTLSDSSVVEKNCSILLILNSCSVGGMKFNKEADISDGLIDVIMVDSKIQNNKKVNSIISSLRIFNVFLRGINKKRELNHVSHFVTKSVKAELSDDITWCIDGERGNQGSQNIQMLHHHIKMIAK